MKLHARSERLALAGLFILALELSPLDGGSMLHAQESVAASSFQSIGFQDRFIRHKDFNGLLDPIQSDVDRRDASFALVAGLSGSGSFSFLSANMPGYFFRHQNWELRLQKFDGSDQFKLDASFRIVPGLSGKGGFSFESINFPGYFIRHQNFRLVVNQNDGSELFRKDSTFIIKTSLAP